MIARPYQQRLVDRAIKALSEHGNTLAVAATGAGKTIMLSMLAREIGGKQLILQHRQELVRQNLNKYRQVNPKASCGLWTADVKSFRASATFAMVQSLAGHLERLPKLDLIIADEAHHCAAPSWRAVIEAAKEKNPSLLVAGFTATPNRSDRKGLRHVFSNCCEQITIRELVQMGFLVPPRGFVIDVSGTQQALMQLGAQSDFGEQSDVAAILNTPAINAEVVRHWKAQAAERQTIVFCSTVQHAQDVAAAFSAADVAAGCIHGGMGDGQRKALLSRLADGQLQVLTNVAVLTEGFDHPPVSCIILLRKCSDKGPLIQMAGRGLRTVDPKLFPGIVKRDCHILDFGVSLLTHGDLIAETDLDGNDGKPKEGEPLTKFCPTEARGGLRFPDANGRKGCGAELPVQTRTCPFCGFLFESTEETDTPVTRVELSEMDILNASPWRYIDLFGTGRILMASGFSAWAGIFSPDAETWHALGKPQAGAVETVMIGERLQAMAAADDYLRLHETESGAKKTKRWLDDPASEKQLDMLARFGYSPQFDLLGNSGFTKYSAACHANFQFSRRYIESALGL